jgi:hypothetical protein
MARSIVETTMSASLSRPCCTSQRGDSGTSRRIHQTTTAATTGKNTTHRHPAIPNGARGVSAHERAATVGTERNITPWLKANAFPRLSRFDSSAMKLSIVIISTPRPRPATNRHAKIPVAVLCRPMTRVAAAYQRSA